MKYWEVLKYMKENNLTECTSAGSVATVPGNGKSTKGTIGAGFDANGDWGVYDFAKKKDKKKTNEDDGEESVIKR